MKNTFTEIVPSGKVMGRHGEKTVNLGREFSSLVPPVFRASTVKFSSLDDFMTRSARLPDGFSYGTTGTPTHRNLEERIAKLDLGSHCVVVPSGQAAITLVMLTVLKAGDHLLISDSAYGPALTFAVENLAALGVSVERYAPTLTPLELETLLKPNTKLLWMESPGSITMEVQDVVGLAAKARAHGVLTAVDNTWSSPLYFRPLSYGVDFCLHACTKYMGGHSDLLMGSISMTNPALYKRVRHLQSYMGQAPSADDCFLVERGLDTMSIRLKVQSENALYLAAWLEKHNLVDEVMHPALESSPSHELWKQYFQGSGSVFTFAPVLASLDAYRHFFAEMSAFSIGASWGSVHSLIAFYPEEVQYSRRFPLVHRPLIRISVGLEPVASLQADLAAAFDRLKPFADKP